MKHQDKSSDNSRMSDNSPDETDEDDSTSLQADESSSVVNPHVLYSFPNGLVDATEVITDFSDDEVDGYRSPAPSRHHYYDEGVYEEVLEEDLVEIDIEALTGTRFRVPVSPKETVRGLKHLLYRTEGLAVSQQHLLLGEKELLDDLTLGEQGVMEGTTLKLVTSMKGGPINARKTMPHEDLLWRRVNEYIDDKSSDESWDSQGGRAVTLLVLRDGDSVNLYRVVEHEDGTFSPLNQSWGSNNSTSQRSMKSRIEEDARTEAKFADLKAKMEAVKLRGKKKKKSTERKKYSAGSKKSIENSPRSLKSKQHLPHLLQPHLGRGSSDIVNDVTEKYLGGKYEQRRPQSGTLLKKRNNTGKTSRPTTQEQRSVDRRHSTASRTSMQPLREIPLLQKPREYYFSGKRPLENIKPKSEKGTLNRVDENHQIPLVHNKIDENVNTQDYASYRESLVKHGKKSTPSISIRKENKHVTPSGPAPIVRRNGPPLPLYNIPSHVARPKRDVDPLYSSHNNFDRLTLAREFENRPKTSPEILERRPVSCSGESTVSEKIHRRNPNDQLMDLMNILNSTNRNNPKSRRNSKIMHRPLSKSFDRNSKLNNIQRAPITPKPSLASSLASVHFNNSFSKPSTAKSSIGESTSYQDQNNILRDFIKSKVHYVTSRLPTPEKRSPRRPVSGRGHIPQSPAKFPPVTPKSRKKKSRRPRCGECNSKISIATTFHCRCERIFCAEHRYAETHSCSYDYKNEGRKLLQMANPLVEPQKLPKI